jgi:hypothetical protein
MSDASLDKIVQSALDALRRNKEALEKSETQRTSINNETQRTSINNEKQRTPVSTKRHQQVEQTDHFSPSLRSALQSMSSQSISFKKIRALAPPPPLSHQEEAILTNTARKLTLNEREDKDIGVQTDDAEIEIRDVDEKSLNLLASLLSCIKPECDKDATVMQLRKMNPVKVSRVLDKIVDNLLSLYV